MVCLDPLSQSLSQGYTQAIGRAVLSPEGFTGEDLLPSSFTFLLTKCRSSQVIGLSVSLLPGGLPLSLCPLLNGFPQRVAYNMTAYFLQSKCPKREEYLRDHKQEGSQSFYNPVRKWYLINFVIVYLLEVKHQVQPPLKDVNTNRKRAQWDF